MYREEIEIIRQMRKTGRELFLRGLVGSHSGNMSVRSKDSLYITRTRAMLGRLKEEDIVKLPLYGSSEEEQTMASSDTSIHISIYRRTDALAILHAHPPYAVLLSILGDMDHLSPLDWEGKLIVGSIHFIDVNENEKREERISNSLIENKIVVVRGHGTFARGESLEEAYLYTMSLESSCFFLYHLEILNKGRS